MPCSFWCACQACTERSRAVVGVALRDAARFQARVDRRERRIAREAAERRRKAETKRKSSECYRARQRQQEFAAWEAGLLYEFMQRWPGELTLKRAATLSAMAHGLPPRSVLPKLQATHGQGNRRGRPKKDAESREDASNIEEHRMAKLALDGLPVATRRVMRGKGIAA